MRTALTLLAFGAVSTGVVLMSLPSAASDWPTHFCSTIIPPTHPGSCEVQLGPKIPDLRREKTIVFGVIGDMGTGESEQFTVANALSTTCIERHCQFLISVGDNLYDGPTRLDDPRMQTWFEKPYQRLDLPFWMSLGNHDWYGDPAMEIRYTGIAARRRKGPYWFMPGPAYRVPKLPPFLRLVAIDTMSMERGMEAGLKDQKVLLDVSLPPAGAAADGTWAFLFGHHPWRSSGAHGDTKEVEAFLKPWLDGARVDGVFFGHDHHQEHYDYGAAQVFIQGASGQIRERMFDGERRRCTSAAHRDCSRWSALRLGFSIVTVTAETLVVSYFRIDEATRAAKVDYVYETRRDALLQRQKAR
ncbi:MAG: metallophosphoesterase [Myxococcales bacterium]|nr:metallophosphoesterase [Myxococcales bacterium]